MAFTCSVPFAALTPVRVSHRTGELVCKEVATVMCSLLAFCQAQGEPTPWTQAVWSRLEQSCLLLELVLLSGHVSSMNTRYSGSTTHVSNGAYPRSSYIYIYGGLLRRWKASFNLHRNSNPALSRWGQYLMSRQTDPWIALSFLPQSLSLIHIWRCRRRG